MPDQASPTPGRQRRRSRVSLDDIRRMVAILMTVMILTVIFFLSVMLWVWLYEVPGALMAVPVLVSFKVICDNIPSMHWIGVLLGSPDQDSPAAPDA